MDKRVFESLTDDEFFVIYWDCQGFRYGDIEEKFGYSVSWIQKRATSAHKKFGINKLVPTERNKILENEVCPALHEWIENHPEKVKRLTEPDYPPEDPEMETTLTPPPTPKVITVVSKDPKKPPNYCRLIILAIVMLICLLVVSSGVGYGAYMIGKRSTPLPAVVQIITATFPPFTQTPIPSPTLPSTLTIVATDTPVPTDTETPLPPTPEFYEAGKWLPLNGTLYVRLNEDFYSMPDCRPKPQEFGVELQFHNDGDQYLLRYDPSSFQAVDDTGKVYKLLGAGHIFCNEIGVQNIDVKRGDSHITLLFGGSIPLETKYLIITADSINGVRLVFHKSI